MTVKKCKTRKSRAEKRAKNTRNKLKESAPDIFSAKSVDSATVEEITEKADLGKGTLYRHFSDKDDVVITLVQDAVEHLIKTIRSSAHRPATLDEMLKHLFRAHYEFYLNAREEFLLLVQGKLLLKLRSATWNELEQPYLLYITEIENQISPYVSPLNAREKIRVLVCALTGFVFGYLSFAMIGMDSTEIEKTIEPLAGVLMEDLHRLLDK